MKSFSRLVSRAFRHTPPPALPAGSPHPPCPSGHRQAGPGHPGSDGTRQRTCPYSVKVTRTNTLGEYLRARRELVDPGSVGLRRGRRAPDPGPAPRGGRHPGGHQRGLLPAARAGPRPQPVAAGARGAGPGVRAGRDRHPVPAEPACRGPGDRRRRRAARWSGRASGSCSVSRLPAFVESRMFDVLAANRLAPRLSPHPAGQNRLRSVFLDEGEQELHPDWGRPSRAGRVVPRLARHDANDPRIASSSASCRWPASRSASSGRGTMSSAGRGAGPDPHPQVGVLESSAGEAPIGDSGGQLLVMYHAEPGSDSAGRWRCWARWPARPCRTPATRSPGPCRGRTACGPVSGRRR